MRRKVFGTYNICAEKFSAHIIYVNGSSKGHMTMIITIRYLAFSEKCPIDNGHDSKYMYYSRYSK